MDALGIGSAIFTVGMCLGLLSLQVRRDLLARHCSDCGKRLTRATRVQWWDAHYCHGCYCQRVEPPYKATCKVSYVQPYETYGPRQSGLRPVDPRCARGRSKRFRW
jgi:hypothetical protein